MTAVIVLAVHGMPPADFPREELQEFFGLHARVEHAVEERAMRHGAMAEVQRRHAELHAKMRAWPRTPANDPFCAASHALAATLARMTGQEVIVGFNEFCGPSLDEALDKAVLSEVDRVLVTTPMMTRGGEHAEVDIPEAIRRAQVRYPQASIDYVWPFADAAVAGFLADQLRQFDNKP
jgi:sirohydrochlorin cobaltochelatase